MSETILTCITQIVTTLITVSVLIIVAYRTFSFFHYVKNQKKLIILFLLIQKQEYLTFHN